MCSSVGGICERSIGLLSCTLHTSSNPAAHSSHDSHNLPYLLPGRGHTLLTIPSHPIPLVLGLCWAVTLATSADSLVAINWSRALSSGLCASAPSLARLSASLEPPQSSLPHSAVSQLPSLSIRLFVYSSIRLSICSSIHLFIYPSVRPSGWFAVCLSIRLSIPSICPSVSSLVGSSLSLFSPSLLSLSPSPFSLSPASPLPPAHADTYTHADTRITHIRPSPPFSFPPPLSRSHTHTVRVVAVSNPHITPIEL